MPENKPTLPKERKRPHIVQCGKCGGYKEIGNADFDCYCDAKYENNRKFRELLENE